MSDVATAPVAATSPGTPKKAKSKTATAASKKPRVKPTHPKTCDMVNSAIKDLKERGGSSLQAIKKYIASNYKVDAEKMAPFIRKYLKTAVTSGSLVQTKGKGASGSFKLAVGEKVVAKKSKTAKPVSSKSKKTKVTASKTAAVKKSASSAPKKVTKPKTAKPTTPSKAKKTTKAPTKKPKAPKPKKAGAAKPTKKVAPKKK